MKYVVQLNTGTLTICNYSLAEVLKQLEFITSNLDVTMVIFGWYQDVEFNKAICDFLKKKQINSIFKLPIFSEITDLAKEDAYIYFKDELNKSDHHFYDHDKFDFVCPSSSKNTDYILEVFDNIDKFVNFDGVFFDRIRYPASSVKYTSIYGCQCDECKKLYNNINLKAIKSFRPSKRIGTHYEYSDINANKLMSVKRKVITSQVKKLTNHLKKKNKIIGIDTFSLNLCDFVGQDIEELSKYVDFIKPMNYYKTNAPAGIPYEFHGLDKDIQVGINQLWNEDVLSLESSVEMSKELLKIDKRITIGIDANYVQDICIADQEYVLEHVKKLEKSGIKEVVLSWNSMLLSEELILALKSLK